MRYVLLGCWSLFIAAGCAPKADISASKLAAAYRDAAKADALYKEKTLTVSGAVIYSGSMVGLQYQWCGVTLEGENGDEKRYIECHFPPQAAKRAENLRSGQIVVIRGLCKGKGWFGAPYLTNCEVLD